MRIALSRAGIGVLAVSSLLLASNILPGFAQPPAPLGTPPFTGNGAGTVSQPRSIGHTSPANTWATTLPGAPGIIVRGTVNTAGREWDHTYAQANCPANYTLITTPTVITERYWGPGNTTTFVAQMGNAGILTGRVAQRTEEAISPQVQISGTEFFRESNTSFWRARVVTWNAVLVSTTNMRGPAGSFRDAATAANGRAPTSTISYVNICQRQLQGSSSSTSSSSSCGEEEDCPVDDVCGDGILTGEEQCDDGNSTDDDWCNNSCQPNYCGDGVTQSSLDDEQCDDGNSDDGDGCSTMCVEEYCGDGLIDEGIGETCDDENTDSDDGCSSTCQEEFCGDSVVNGSEQCDDGNTDDNDGCSAICELEE